MTELPRLRLRVTFANGLTFGPGKADLLAGIRETGSIAAAGRTMGMSYKRAWSLVEEMNKGFRLPLVHSARGGAGGGGASLTDEGLRVLAHYENLMARLRMEGAADLAAIEAGLAEGEAPIFDMSGGK